MNSAETSAVPNSPEKEAQTPVPAQKRSGHPVLILAVVLLLAIAGFLYYRHTQTYQETDDAQIECHLDPVSSRVDGTILAVHVENNAVVQAGEPLLELDTADSSVALTQHQALYDQARAQVSASHPNVPITRTTNASDASSQEAEVANASAALAAAEHDLDADLAKLTLAQAADTKAQADFARYQLLYSKNEAARADFDQYRSAAEEQQAAVSSAEAEVASARAVIEQRRAALASQQTKLHRVQQNGPLQLAIREADIKTLEANAEVNAAKLVQAKLNLAYTHIAAPVAGVITQRGAEVGAHIAAGQQLMMIVETGNLWVTANFKETQLGRMHPGQKVHIHVDALKGDFSGEVDSMPAATGSATSVLPPENASGNYVKVVQRLPVRIRFDPGQRDLGKLRPGMSVEPRVELD